MSSTSNTESACQSACNGNSACLGFGYHSTASTGSRYEVLSFTNHLRGTMLHKSKSAKLPSTNLQSICERRYGGFELQATSPKEGCILFNYFTC